MFNRSAWNHLTVKIKSSGSFKYVKNKMCLEIIYLIYMYKGDLAFNNLQWLICHKTLPKQTNKNTISHWIRHNSKLLIGKLILNSSGYCLSHQFSTWWSYLDLILCRFEAHLPSTSVNYDDPSELTPGTNDRRPVLPHCYTYEEFFFLFWMTSIIFPFLPNHLFDTWIRIRRLLQKKIIDLLCG